MIARECFDAIATHASELQPAARGAAIAATLRQIGEIAGDLPLDLRDASIGYEILSRPGECDDDRTRARRATCGEIAQICRAYTGECGSAGFLAAVFDRVVERFAGTEDPRQRAMAETAARESRELRLATA